MKQKGQAHVAYRKGCPDREEAVRHLRPWARRRVLGMPWKVSITITPVTA